MAGLGFKDFQVGEVLTSSDVDGYLMQQTVMRFADSGARGSALGTAPGTAVALAEGMVSYLDDVNALSVYTGTVWESVSPAGMIGMFAADSAPEGWLKANGATISRTTYSRLFAAIGTAFGPGDGSTTFDLPDLRGEFVRGWDDGRGVDSGRVFGSAQADEFESHSHDVTYYTSNNNPSNLINTYVYNSGTRTAATSSEGGAETRPRNLAMLACIKF